MSTLRKSVDLGNLTNVVIGSVRRALEEHATSPADVFII
jgi:hypothetical protein